MGIIEKQKLDMSFITNIFGGGKKKEAEIQQCMKSGQKDKAKRILKTVKMERDQLVNLQNKATLLSKQVVQIESIQDDDGFASAITDANKVMQGNQEKQEQLQEQLELNKELENEAKMNNEMINNMIADS